jgi:uncharacterized protein YeaO (DUF488 family)
LVDNLDEIPTSDNALTESETFSHMNCPARGTPACAAPLRGVWRQESQEEVGAVSVTVRRVYEDPAPGDGTRVLVDRVWPRGLTKEAAHLDEWIKDVAPSGTLRTWYGHVPERFGEFRSRYLAELDAPERQAALDRLRRLMENGPLTLLTATRDVEHSQAAVLAEVLSEPRR